MKPSFPNFLKHLRVSLETMSPAYFSMVMATGILSQAAYLLAVPVLPTVLFVLNWILFAIICLLAVARAYWHTRRVIGDLFDHLRAPGFFTFVAACGVLGGQCLTIGDSTLLAALLGILGLVGWIVLTYTIFTVLTVKENKPSLDSGISGSWLLAVVATQAMAVLGAMIAAKVAQPIRLELNFFALSMWLWGGMLYIWMMSLIFYRYTFFRFSPADLSPPYWINMGAMAISTLAGSQLIMNTQDAPFLASILPFIKGFTVFYWATGTWWIPMLVFLAVWRHGVKRFPFGYDPLYWGAVFPLGMYAACTRRMSAAMQIDFLSALPPTFLTLGLCAWVILCIGLIHSLRRHWAASTL
jgi:tellurite resistance protein TehA-like permease